MDPIKRTAVAFTAHVPLEMEVPEWMCEHVEAVLRGEYESGYFGEGLSVLDIGANVGSFSIWASLRWPRSTIHAYEPHPGTFAILGRNLAGYLNVNAHNVAVYPMDQGQAQYFARYDGDGEAGLLDCMTRTFAELRVEQTFPVCVMHPAALPPADVVKLDVEGAEADILQCMDLSGIALILLEYQQDSNRKAIKQRLADDFVLEHEDVFPWDALLDNGSGYRRDLAGDHYGHMFFSNRRPGRVRKLKAVS